MFPCQGDMHGGNRKRGGEEMSEKPKAFLEINDYDEAIKYLEVTRGLCLNKNEKTNLKYLIESLGKELVFGFMNCVCMCGREHEMQMSIKRSSLEGSSFLKDCREQERIKAVCPACQEVQMLVITQYGEDKCLKVTDALWGSNLREKKINAFLEERDAKLRELLFSNTSQKLGGVVYEMIPRDKYQEALSLLKAAALRGKVKGGE